MNLRFFLWVCLLSPVCVWAQSFSIGVTGGVGLTDAFIDQTIPNIEAGTHTYSNAKDYLVGPAVEVRLPFSLAVELDALYRPLHLTDAEFSLMGPGPINRVSQGTISTWELPLLAKYRFPGHFIRPFIEAGPSFRHGASSALLLGNISLSDHGFTAGGGGEIYIWKLRIAPQVRYTRWAADTPTNPISLPAFRTPTSNVNQAELLVGLWF